MLKGINLTLMIGPAVPVPVPAEVLDALTSVTVHTSAGEQRSGFSLTFSLSNQSPLQTIFLLTAGSLPPIMRVVIVVTINGTPEVLMDGVITRHEIAPGNDPGHSTLTLSGEDLLALMDLIDFTGIPYPAMPPEARVLLCIAKYAFFGMIPLVLPSVLIDIPIPIERIPRHQGTDLAYINYLADFVGYVFYLTPGPKPLMNTAYWGPEIKVGAPQPALSINMDAHSNVESLNFNFRPDQATLPIVFIQNQATKVPIPIPVPPITPLNPPLGVVQPFPQKIEFISETAKYNPLQGALVGMAKAAKTADTVAATGTLDVMRYGRLLKARKLVGVRGAGLAFDGLYYVKSVTHQIKRGEYKQSFELSRNGLISITPKVPV
ncbi:MAG TPA: hypothetical protein VIQ24_07505 [Pyrinomonadaceae bacterium]